MDIHLGARCKSTLECVVGLVLLACIVSCSAYVYEAPSGEDVATLTFEPTLATGRVEVSIFANPDECQAKAPLATLRGRKSSASVSLLAGTEAALIVIYNALGMKGIEAGVRNATAILKFVPEHGGNYKLLVSHDDQYFFWQLRDERDLAVKVTNVEAELEFETDCMMKISKWCVGNRERIE